MKSFSAGSAKRIAKYVKIFFHGALSVKGLGQFSFSQGRLNNPDNASKQQQVLVKTVNDEIEKRRPTASWNKEPA